MNDRPAAMESLGRPLPPAINPFAQLEEPAAESHAGFDLRYIAAAIRSNLWLILAIIGAALALAVVATFLQTPRYTAFTTIQINDASERVLKNDSEDSTNPAAGYDVDRFLNTQTDILKSRAIADRVEASLRLSSDPRFFESEEVRTSLAKLTPADKRELAIGLLRSHVAVSLPRDTRIVTISFDSTNPAMSAKIANAFANEFIQSNLQRKYDSSAYARNFISQQLAETKAKLEGSERALNDYARGAGLIRLRDASAGTDGKSGGGGGDTGSVTTSSLLQLNGAANQAKANRIAAESRWRAVNDVPLMSSKEVLANPTVTTLLTQKADLEGKLQEERAKHLEDYPTVAALRGQLNVINQQLQTAATNVRNSVKADYTTALDSENQLEGQVTKLKSATLTEQDSNVQYSLLSREADTNRQLYDGLLQRFKELNASAGVSTSNISIIDTAAPPSGPSSPNLMKYLAAALIAGIALAAMTVFLRDQFDDSIRVPEDVEHKLGVHLLGVIPRPRGAGDPEEDLGDPKSAITEAYNSLRGSLLYSSAGGLPHVLLVTSAQPAEGKTTTSYALGLGLARMGKRVVLVDADMRRPSVHRRIGSKNEIGLSTLLTSEVPIERTLQSGGAENLSLLTSGPVPPSPTELVSSARMEQVLQGLAQRFDVVILDSPPVLGLADSPTMATLADGVLFVVEADRNRRGALKMALRRLRAVHPVILGAALTKFDPLKAGNRYSEYYGYGYYHYSHAPGSEVAEA